MYFLSGLSNCFYGNNVQYDAQFIQLLVPGQRINRDNNISSAMDIQFNVDLIEQAKIIQQIYVQNIVNDVLDMFWFDLQ